MVTKSYRMKRHSTLFLTIGIAALMALASGCSTVQKTENLLSAAGFKVMPATTPQQQAHLKTLPQGKVTVVVREGTTYFVFPDVKQQVIYVGQQPQYDAYQRLRLQQQLAAEQAQAAEAPSEALWGHWGAWGGMGFAAPPPPPMFRR
jgi:hypothetical protein